MRRWDRHTNKGYVQSSAPQRLTGGQVCPASLKSDGAASPGTSPPHPHHRSRLGKMAAAATPLTGLIKPEGEEEESPLRQQLRVGIFLCLQL